MTADITTGKLSQGAQHLLERYLRDLRFSLRGCPSVDPAEVEAEVRQHIDQELAGAAHPVTGEQLGVILNKLGSPTQWVPLDELPWWRRTMLAMRAQSTDDRWAVWVFVVFVVGMLLVPAEGLGFVLILASFLLARAVLAMGDETGQTLGWRRWLIYPTLLSVYLPLLPPLLLWALVAAVVPEQVAGAYANQLSPETRRALDSPPMAIFSGAAGLGVWWMIVGVICLIAPRVPAALFRPFFARRPRRLALALLVLGGVLVAAAGLGAAIVL